ncbi:alpha-amylase 3, chloroplastic isoform X3 [Abrus precatorius]|uniref:alpha-amylase n=1 Tax=Abrus precatorius TaxID=3816 RepID=A0A8B8KXV4_ABRPR|nr:alpha-amylase 3, chloroplastic isoform X3 [Abrus precatorius]
MSISNAVSIDPLLLSFNLSSNYRKEREASIHRSKPKPFSLTSSSTLTLFSTTNNNNYNYVSCKPHKFHGPTFEAFATNTDTLESLPSSDVLFNQTFPVNRIELVEGKIFVRLDQGKDLRNWELTVGCNLSGKWILHWGVSRVDDVGSEWDQPPHDMIPPGSIPIKDYAIETPMKKSASTAEGDTFHEVRIDLKPHNEISAINFVLKDEETGAWYQHKGRDFKVPLVNYLKEEANVIGPKRGFSLWPGALGQISNILLKSEATHDKVQDDNSGSIDPKLENSQLEGFYVELPIAKEVIFNNSISVSIRKCSETANNLLYLKTDIPGDILLHWGVCRDDLMWWEIPPAPHPPETVAFKDRALRTKLQSRDNGEGSSVQLSLGGEFSGFLFVLKLNDNTWLNDNGNDFYIPLSSSSSLIMDNREGQSEPVQREVIEEAGQEESSSAFTDGIINEIRHLVTDISSEKNRNTKSKKAQESILQEIEKLAAEAYSIFRSSVPTFTEETIAESEAALESKTLISPDLPLQVSSGTGTGYGTIDELKDVVKTFHEVGIKVLGDVVLNHRCAHYRNQNGIWNIFGGRLDWDDRAIVADDPHFQGRGNKSSGDNFHAAPNIDHSQEFVRKDLKEWLCWLRKEIGYDGWRLDFVRGFWGGYVKDYLEASEPYFAVGEYWDSLSYTYGEMDHNQDAHRQRIIDWINATSGIAGAFDVTTKGILHSALERCEYWRLSDQKGKPPGVLGWWPSRAVTFIENHDTGSTQGHWRFPNGKEMQGYAYTLTHPGTPSVFFDHLFSHYKTEIAALLSIRKQNKIHCRSTVQICKAERDVYAAIIDEKIAMKIGPGHFEPPSGSQNWSSAWEGRDYKIWEAS